MNTLFDATDIDGDRVTLLRTEPDEPGVAAIGTSCKGTGSSAVAYLTDEDVADLRSALAQLAEPDDEADDAAYDDGYADGYAAGVLDGAEMPKPMSHEEAFRKAVELSAAARSVGAITERMPFEHLLGLAAYLRGDLPVPPAQ